ncbi:hypothetical protein [Undibacter mobilis]|nr:hypothetical protein [Undibacter mobilis]
MRSRDAVAYVGYRVARKARLGMIVFVAAGVAVSFWIRFFRSLARSEGQS